ncbi:MAG: hypothetical protein V3R31_04725, partial [Candidatus Humimicrobiaceae bacterium]
KTKRICTAADRYLRITGICYSTYFDPYHNILRKIILPSTMPSYENFLPYRGPSNGQQITQSLLILAP